MTAQAQPQQRGTEIQFPPNVAITVSMKYAQPRLVAGKYGERYMFTTTDDCKFFVDPPVAAQIAELGVNTNEPFAITRHESGRKGEAARWQVARLNAGPQQDGTYVVPRDPGAPPANAVAAVAAKPMARAEHVSSLSLAEEAKFAVDAFAEVLNYGLKEHGGKVKPDEIQRIFTTVYIQRRGAA